MARSFRRKKKHLLEMFSTDSWHNDRKKPHKIFDCQTLEVHALKGT